MCTNTDYMTHVDKNVATVCGYNATSVIAATSTTLAIYQFDIPEEALLDTIIDDAGILTSLKSTSVAPGITTSSIAWLGDGYPLRIADVVFDSVDVDTATNILCQLSNNMIPLYCEAVPEGTQILEVASSISNLANSSRSATCSDTISCRMIIPVWMGSTKYCGF